MNKPVGKVSNKFNKISNLNVSNDTIYIGEQNITHIKSKHLEDYNKYFKYLEEILNKPDYIAVNPKDTSLEYVKEFFFEETNEYVKVAVRVSGKGKYFVRSLYCLNENRVRNFIRKGKLIDFNSIK